MKTSGSSHNVNSLQAALDQANHAPTNKNGNRRCSTPSLELSLFKSGQPNHQQSETPGKPGNLPGLELRAKTPRTSNEDKSPRLVVIASTPMSSFDAEPSQSRSHSRASGKYLYCSLSVKHQTRHQTSHKRHSPHGDEHGSKPKQKHWTGAQIRLAQARRVAGERLRSRPGQARRRAARRRSRARKFLTHSQKRNKTSYSVLFTPSGRPAQRNRFPSPPNSTDFRTFIFVYLVGPVSKAELRAAAGRRQPSDAGRPATNHHKNTTRETEYTNNTRPQPWPCHMLRA